MIRDTAQVSQLLLAGIVAGYLFIAHGFLSLFKQWLSIKPGFHMSGKSQTIADFTFLPTIPDIRQTSVPDFRETLPLFVIRELVPSN